MSGGDSSFTGGTVKLLALGGIGGNSGWNSQWINVNGGGALAPAGGANGGNRPLERYPNNNGFGGDKVDLAKTLGFTPSDIEASAAGEGGSKDGSANVNNCALTGNSCSVTISGTTGIGWGAGGGGMGGSCGSGNQGGGGGAGGIKSTFAGAITKVPNEAQKYSFEFFDLNGQRAIGQYGKATDGVQGYVRVKFANP